MSETIVFFGNERLATAVQTKVSVLSALIKAGYKIPMVVSNYSGATSRTERSLEIQGVADSHSIPLLLPSKLLEIRQQIADCRADLGVLVAYGKIVPQEIIDLFPLGIINIHPSLLPRHRGSTPIESVILNGDAKTGVSIMQLAKQMDGGPVFAQSEVGLNGQESKQELSDTLLDIGTAMMIELLPGIIQGSVAAQPQDEAAATYDQQIAKSDGLLDWSKPAHQLEREIRAYLGWPGSRTVLSNKEVIVTKVHVIDKTGVPGQYLVEDKKLVIFTGQKAVVIDRLKPAGKPEMTIQAFLAGYKHLL